MVVKIKLLSENSVLPRYSKPGDAGMDLTCTEVSLDASGCYVYRTALAVEIPQGFFGLLVPRSSVANKSLILSNHAGILDSGYRGEIMFKYKPNYQYFLQSEEVKEQKIYSVGDRVGQLIIMPYPEVAWHVVDELSDSERGAGSYGSTGA
jgi:dUTP pyrophosphatase